MEEEFIQQRQRYLERYMDELLTIPPVLQSPSLAEFLRIPPQLKRFVAMSYQVDRRKGAPGHENSHENGSGN